VRQAEMLDRISRINRIDGIYGIDSSLKTSDPVLAQIRLHLINLSLGIDD